MTAGGLGIQGDRFHTVNFVESTGDITVQGTSTLGIFVAPISCEIIDVGFMVTTTISTDANDHWTIQMSNQTGNANLLSTAFDTDSDNSGNGGRAITADTFNSLTDDSAGTSFLQNAVLAKGDIILLTATKGTSAADLVNPTVLVHYRV